MSTNCNCSKCKKLRNTQGNKRSSCTDDDCVACQKYIHQETRYWCDRCNKYHQIKNAGWVEKNHYTNNIYSKRNPILKNNQKSRDPKKSNRQNQGSKLKRSTKSKSKKGEKPNTDRVGPAGPIGLRGPKGDAGPNGLTGPIGPQGLVGASGKTGSKGDSGTQGIQGPTGKDGIGGQNTASGIKGDVGPQGDQGISGPPGKDGTNGQKGDAGPQGSLGAKGDVGLQGIKGPSGINGQKGNAGPQGSPGRKGDIGSRGFLGIKGEVGPQGSRGLPGVDGKRGNIGPQGPPGTKGDIGPQGIQGPSGKDGQSSNITSENIQGPPGQDGLDGQKGDIGPQGTQGSSGKDGLDGQKGDIGQSGQDGLDGETTIGRQLTSYSKGIVLTGTTEIPGNSLVLIDDQSGPISLILPTNPPDGTTIVIKNVRVGGSTSRIEIRPGDVFNETIESPTGFSKYPPDTLTFATFQGGITGESYEWMFCTSTTPSSWVLILDSKALKLTIPLAPPTEGSASIIKLGSKIFEEQKDTCCPIITEFGVGSGFFIREDGYICTCAHVVLASGGSIPNANRASIVIVDLTNANGVKGKNVQVRCDIVGIDQAADIAVLKVRTTSQDSIFGFNLTNQSSIVWGDSTNALEGSPCHVIGQPEGIDRRSISSGTLRDNKFIATSNPLAPEGIFFDAPIHPGNSGSPVFDSIGKVIGMACYSYTSSTGNGGIISLEDMAGGTCQYIMQHVTNSIISTGSDYDGNKKGYLGLGSWTPCIGVELYNLRVNNPAFSLIGEANGLVVKSLDIIGGVSGRRAHQATIPILVNDVLLEIQVKNQDNTKIKLGVYDDQYHIGRMTWLHPPGTILTLTVIRPSTGQTFTTDLTLDVYPDQKDVVFSSSNFKSIDTLSSTVNHLIREN